METQKRNAKTPDPSANGSSLEQPGAAGKNGMDESPPLSSPEQEDDPVSGNVIAISDEPEAENVATVDEKLSPILEVSQRFMTILRKNSWKGLSGHRNYLDDREAAGEKRKAPASRRLRDWDTRLFVLSTLKRLADNEHFEELEEEDSRVQFTRESMRVRNRMMEGKDQRQRRRQKEEKLLQLTRQQKAVDVGTGLNTREKQRIEKSKKWGVQNRKINAGQALGDALQKVNHIKYPQEDMEIPENNAERYSEIKEQDRQKRSFFNFSKD